MLFSNNIQQILADALNTAQNCEEGDSFSFIVLYHHTSPLPKPEWDFDLRSTLKQHGLWARFVKIDDACCSWEASIDSCIEYMIFRI